MILNEEIFISFFNRHVFFFFKFTHPAMCVRKKHAFSKAPQTIQSEADDG